MTAEIKPICGLQRTRLASVIPLRTPFSVFIFPTTFCNFKCIYCAHSLGLDEMKKRYDFTREHMSMETYEKAIEQLSCFPERVKLLSLTGQGEPLLNSNIARMVRLAKQSGAFERVEIITNASMLTNALAYELIDAGLDTLRVSLQGLSTEKYRDICGAQVSFDTFMANLRYFYTHRKNTSLFVKVMDVALEPGEEQKFYHLFGDCSDRMFIEKMLPAYDGVKLTEKMDVRYDRYGREITKRRVCPLPFFMLGILPNGDVEPCDTIYKPIILGNVHTDNLLSMWNSQRLKDFWKMQLKGEKRTNPRCAVCHASDDVAHPEDVLDDAVPDLLKLLDERSDS